MDTSGTMLAPGIETLAEDVVGPIAVAGHEQHFLVSFMRVDPGSIGRPSVRARHIPAP